MKKLIALALIPLLALTANAAPAPYPITINSQAVSTPQIEAYKGGQLVVRVSFRDGGAASDITSLTPFMTWSTNATASTVATSAYSVVTATNGTCDFTFTGANMNYAGGRYIYEVGLIQTNAQVSVYRQGVLVIRGSPYASGGTSVTWATNQNWAIINWVGLPTTLAGYGILNGVTTTDPIYLNAVTNVAAGTGISVSRAGDIITVVNTGASADTNVAIQIATNAADVMALAKYALQSDTNAIRVGATGQAYTASVTLDTAATNATRVMADLRYVTTNSFFLRPGQTNQENDILMFDNDFGWWDPIPFPGVITEDDPVVGAITGIIKADGAGNIAAADAGTDYAAVNHTHTVFTNNLTMSGSVVSNTTVIFTNNTAMSDLIYGGSNAVQWIRDTNTYILLLGLP